MNKYIVYLLALFITITLSACDNDDDDDGQTTSIFLQIAEQDADSAPAELDNDELASDITEIFGDKDSATTDVLVNDTVRDIVNRADED